ncbi:MAG: hypothetical protein AAFV38_15855, partial [Pseudomonadota bacterium]
MRLVFLIISFSIMSAAVSAKTAKETVRDLVLQGSFEAVEARFADAHAASLEGSIDYEMMRKTSRMIPPGLSEALLANWGLSE